MIEDAASAPHPALLKRAGWWFGGALLVATGMAVMYAFDPNATDTPFARCIIHTLTGYWCAGCGITRALHALAHGDVARAFSMNPLVVSLLPFGLLAFAWAGGWRPAWAAPIIHLMLKPMLWAVVIPTYWIARNLPWAPFSWMAPG